MNHRYNIKKLLAISLSMSLLFSSFTFASSKNIDSEINSNTSFSNEKSVNVAKAIDDLNESIKSIESKLYKKTVHNNDLLKLTTNINALEQATLNSNKKATKDTMAAILNAEILLLYLPDNDIASASSAIDNARKTLNIGGYKASIPSEDNMSTLGPELENSINVLLEEINERADFAIDLLKEDGTLLSRPLDRVSVKLSLLSKRASSNEFHYVVALDDENLRKEIISAFVKSEKLLKMAKDSSSKTDLLESSINSAKRALKIKTRTTENKKDEYYIELEQGGGSPVKIIRSSNGFPIKIVDQEITLPTKENLKTYNGYRMYEDHERAFIQRAFETLKIVNRNDEYYLTIELPELPEGFFWQPGYFAVNKKAEYLCYASYQDIDRSPGPKAWKLENVTKEEITDNAYLSFDLLIRSMKDGEHGSIGWKVTTDDHPHYLAERTKCYTQFTDDAWLLFDHSNFLEGWK